MNIKSLSLCLNYLYNTDKCDKPMWLFKLMLSYINNNIFLFTHTIVFISLFKIISTCVLRIVKNFYLCTCRHSSCLYFGFSCTVSRKYIGWWCALFILSSGTTLLLRWQRGGLDNQRNNYCYSQMKHNSWIINSNHCYKTCPVISLNRNETKNFLQFTTKCNPTFYYS